MDETPDKAPADQHRLLDLSDEETALDPPGEPVGLPESAAADGSGAGAESSTENGAEVCDKQSVDDDEDATADLTTGATAGDDAQVVELGTRCVPAGAGVNSDRDKTLNESGSGRRPGRSMSRPVLLIGWCIFLLGSWLLTLGYGATDVGIPLLMQAVMFGLFLAWPAFRLSQDMRPAFFRTLDERVEAAAWRHPQVRRRVFGELFKDWLGLNLVAQVVIWSFFLSSRWHLGQSVWMSGAVAAWSLLSVAIVASGSVTGRAGPRCAAMVGCVLVLLAEPAAMAVSSLLTSDGRPVVWDMRISPMQTIWYLANPKGPWTISPHHRTIIAAAIAGLAGWVVLLIQTRGGRGRRVATA